VREVLCFQCISITNTYFEKFMSVDSNATRLMIFNCTLISKMYFLTLVITFMAKPREAIVKLGITK